VLEIRNMTFGYSACPNLFENVNLQVKKQETLAILGSNGVGKTSLLKCILGFIKAKSGAVYIDGIDAKKISSKEFWHLVSYVPQAKQLNFSYSVLEMVLLGCASSLSFCGKPSNKEIKRAKDALEMVGIGHLIACKCNRISGGELQLVLIARAMVRAPEVIVLDEPESNLDINNQLLILKVLEELKKEKGVTTIINTHYPNHSLKIAEKSLVMGRDCKHEVGCTNEIITKENMRKYFNVESQFFNVTAERKQWKKVFFADDIVEQRGAV